jgi:hypothetical protein
MNRTGDCLIRVLNQFDEAGIESPATPLLKGQVRFLSWRHQEHHDHLYCLDCDSRDRVYTTRIIEQAVGKMRSHTKYGMATDTPPQPLQRSTATATTPGVRRQTQYG